MYILVVYKKITKVENSWKLQKNPAFGGLVFLPISDGVEPRHLYKRLHVYIVQVLVAYLLRRGPVFETRLIQLLFFLLFIYSFVMDPCTGHDLFMVSRLWYVARVQTMPQAVIDALKVMHITFYGLVVHI